MAESNPGPSDETATWVQSLLKDDGQKERQCLHDDETTGILLAHRYFLGVKIPEIYEKPKVVKVSQSVGAARNPTRGFAGVLRDTAPYSGLKLEPIFLSEMSMTADKVYGNRLLLVTLVEDPMMGFASTKSVIRDEQGNMIRLAVYGVPQTVEFAKLLGYGTKLGIINPYHRAPSQGKRAIRVDHPAQILRMGAKVKMCRYCGVEESGFSCSKCGAPYCSRKCQKVDWRDLSHKLICGMMPMAELLEKIQKAKQI